MNTPQPLQKMQQFPKVGDWVSIDFTASLSWGKSGCVIGVFGEMLRIMAANGKKFDAYAKDAILRAGPQ
jgi:hypothetical protein